MIKIIGIIILYTFLVGYDYVSIPNTFVARQIIRASQVMANYNALKNALIDGTKKANVAELYIAGTLAISDARAYTGSTGAFTGAVTMGGAVTASSLVLATGNLSVEGLIAADGNITAGDGTAQSIMQIYAVSTNSSILRLRDDLDADVCEFKYDHTVDKLTVRVNAGSALTVSSSRDVDIPNGDLVISNDPGLVRKHDVDGLIAISGGLTVDTGGNVAAYGPSHATNASKVRIRSGSTEVLVASANGNVHIPNGDLIVSGTVSANGGLVVETGATLIPRSVAIGDWDMTASPSYVEVALGINNANDRVRMLTVMIRGDVGWPDSYDISNRVDTNDAYVGRIRGSATTANNKIQLIVTGSGWFDTSDFDATSYNRGWVTFWYTP